MVVGAVSRAGPWGRVTVWMGEITGASGTPYPGSMGEAKVASRTTHKTIWKIYFFFKQRQNVLIIWVEQNSVLVLLFRRFRFGARDQLEQNSELVPKVEEIENHKAENNFWSEKYF